MREPFNFSDREDEDFEAEVDIVEARSLPTPPTLEENGVMLVSAPLPDALTSETREDPACAGGYRTWAEDDQLVRRVYYPAVVETVREATGATHVYPISHLVRSSLRSDFDSAAGPGGIESPMASSAQETKTS